MKLGIALFVLGSAIVATGGCGGDGEAASRAERDAISVARERVGPRDAEEETVDAEVEGETARVTITLEGLRDDSIEDVRYEFTLRRSNGDWSIVRDDFEFRCREGRGHRDFGATPCL